MLWFRWSRSVAWLWAAVLSTVLYYELAMKVPIPVGITVYLLTWGLRTSTMSCSIWVCKWSLAPKHLGLEWCNWGENVDKGPYSGFDLFLARRDLWHWHTFEPFRSFLAWWICAEIDEIASFRLELTPVQQPFRHEWHIQDMDANCCQRMCHFGRSLPISFKPLGGIPSHLGHKTLGKRSATVRACPQICITRGYL